MKQIIAIVKPFLVEKILDALQRTPLEALSVMEVKGMGKQKSYLERYANTEYSLTFLPKVEITVWVDDLRAEDVRERSSRLPAPAGWATERFSSCRPNPAKP